MAGPLNAEHCLLPYTHQERVSGAQACFEFEPAEVHNFKNAGVYRQPLARLCQALRNHPGHRGTQHGVLERFVGQVGTRLRGPKAGLGSGQGRRRGVERSFGNEALIHQRAVVIKAASGDVDLSAGRLGLLLGLAHAGL